MTEGNARARVYRLAIAAPVLTTEGIAAGALALSGGIPLAEDGRDVLAYVTRPPGQPRTHAVAAISVHGTGIELAQNRRRGRAVARINSRRQAILGVVHQANSLGQMVRYMRIFSHSKQRTLSGQPCHRS